MPRVKSTKPLTEFGQRLDMAIRAEGRSESSTEREAGISKGYLGRMMRGERGATSLDPQKVKSLARLLHVEFEWLFIGDGPMKRRPDTPAALGIVFARQMGAREDAIAAAWEKHRAHELDWNEERWVKAIQSEVERLDREGVPRPEITHAHREAIARQKRRLERARDDGEDGDGGSHAKDGPHRHRASGGGL